MNDARDVGLLRQLGRGFTRRCPRCGSGGLFPTWFRIVDDCPGCGLHFEREPGYWIGAMAMNICFVAAVAVVVLVTGFALTIPDIPVAPLLAITIPIVVIGPIAFFPFSRTVWIAVDRGLLQRLDATERRDERYGH
jgi:uncharacterized protein (DUF983 family)